jgi:hypothetical protein
MMMASPYPDSVQRAQPGPRYFASEKKWIPAHCYEQVECEFIFNMNLTNLTTNVLVENESDSGSNLNPEMVAMPE